MLEEDDATLRMTLHRGQAAEAFWTKNTFKVGEGYPGAVAQSCRPLLSINVASDDNFMRQAVVKAGFHQVLSIPLVSGERVMGVMSIASRDKVPFEERNVQLLTAVGAWAGLAIENARLHANARRLAVLEERNRIGMDLHDGIIQSIYGIGLGLEGAKHLINEDSDAARAKIDSAMEGLNQAIRDLRAYILDLRPRQLDTDGLMSGIKRLIAEYRANTFSEVLFFAARFRDERTDSGAGAGFISHLPGGVSQRRETCKGEKRANFAVDDRGSRLDGDSRRRTRLQHR